MVSNAGQTALKRVLPLALAAVCLWLSFRSTDFKALGSLLRQTSIPLLFAAGLLSVLMSALKATKLGILLRHVHRIPYRILFAAEMVSILVDVVFPLRLQELVRAYIVGRGSGLSAAYVLGTEVVEKSLELFFLIGVVAIFCFTFPLPEPLKLPILAGVAGAVFVVILGLAILCHPALGLRADAILSRLRLPGIAASRHLLSKLIDAVRQTVLRRRALLAVTMITALEWGILAATLQTAALASGLPLTPAMLTGMLVANFVAFAIPSSTSGSVGIYEAAGVAVLVVLFDIPREQALATVLTLHVVMVGSGALAGVAGLRLAHVSLREIRSSAGAATP